MPEELANLTERTLDSLADAAKALGLSAKRLDAVEHQMENLEEAIGQRMTSLEAQMGTMNAYLDNLVREVQTTNNLLRTNLENQKEEAKQRLEWESADRAHRQKMEIANLENHKENAARTHALAEDERATVKMAFSSIWEMFKHPLGYLVTAIAGYFLYHVFGISIPQAP